MSTQTKALNPDFNALAEDASNLVEATANAAEEKLEKARTRLASGVSRVKEFSHWFGDKAVEKAKTANDVVRANPYRTIGIVLGVGAFIGYLAARQCFRESE